MFEVSRIPVRESAADACARVLKGAILAGELEPGAKLPPERQLAESLGVNRLTLRNALAQLAAAGLVSVKQGSGYTVRDYRRAGGLDLLPGLMALSEQRGDSRGLAAELLFLRRHLAGAVLERVAEGATAQDVERVRAAVASFARVVEETRETRAIAAADLEVLAALLAATKSSVLALCFNPVMSVLASFDDLRDAMYVEPETNVRAYQLLLDWLASPARADHTALVAELARRDELTLGRMRGRRRVEAQ